jgi:hypothetical protein
MAFEYRCSMCPETIQDDSIESIIKRAAAHNHDHYGGPAEITPELEASLCARTNEVKRKVTPSA